MDIKKLKKEQLRLIKQMVLKKKRNPFADCSKEAKDLGIIKRQIAELES